MRIAINGTGIAGPTLAWWLRRYGHEPVLFEKAPHLRTGGYVIDFWGAGYEVAEKMGILPTLDEKGYHMKALKLVGATGRTIARLNVSSLGEVLGERFVSIPRGDLAAAIFAACPGVETHFGESISGLSEQDDRITVTTSAGSVHDFDLVIGADGLHSAIRKRAFGRESQFEHPLGFQVAAFAIPGYQPRDELTYVTHTEVDRQAARVALRNDRTLFLFIWNAALSPRGVADAKTILRKVFADIQWEVPKILACLDRAPEIYFDHVSQIRMDHWSKGRVALVGDAAACVSFLAGEGSGLAMTEAYVLAGELHRASGDFSTAFGRYESLLRPFIKAKQKSALSFANFFAPRNKLSLHLRNLAMRASGFRPIARWLIGRAVRDDFDLPLYTA